MRHDLDAALDQCLTQLREGTDIQSCLDRYPEYAAELRPLLELAIDVVRVRVPASSEKVRTAGQQRMLAVLAQKQERLARVHPAARLARKLFWFLVPGRPGSLRPAWQLAVLTLVVGLFASGWVTVASSADSLPGDLLYPVKLASSRSRLALTLNPAKHQLLADQFETQRRLDVQTVLRERRQVSVEFRGVLQLIEGNLWVVSGLPVELLETTTVIGQPSLGAMVHVRADLPGSGELVSKWLTVESTSTPDPTDTERAPTTPASTQTPRPIETHESTRTPRPTATKPGIQATVPSSDPTASSEHTRAPVPTETPEPEETREHEKPDPTETPEPDDTSEHEGTPDPTKTPEPDETREHEGTPDPTETPEPDDTPEHDHTPAPTEEPGD